MMVGCFTEKYNYFSVKTNINETNSIFTQVRMCFYLQHLLKTTMYVFLGGVSKARKLGEKKVVAI